MSPLLVSDNTQSINRRGCRVAGEEGTCMFVWECLKTEGKHLGMCMDGFMFGSCCVHNDDQNKVSDQKVTENKQTTTTKTSPTPSTTSSTSITTTPLPTPERPTRPARPSKPSHFPVKWPNFHLVEQKINQNNNKNDDTTIKDEAFEKIDVEKPSNHIVNVKPPENPRPNLPTR